MMITADNVTRLSDMAMKAGAIAFTVLPIVSDYRGVSEDISVVIEFDGDTAKTFYDAKEALGYILAKACWYTELVAE